MWISVCLVLALGQERPEAQNYFDEGLSLMYGFNRYEALRSFRKAADLDRNAAMAQWGIAMATGPYINMDGDPTYDRKTSCVAVDAGLSSTFDPNASGLTS